MSETIRIPKDSLDAIVQLYDGIRQKDMAFKACQSSAFRKYVLEQHGETAGAFASLEKTHKKGLDVTDGDIKKLVAFDAALAEANAVYGTDAAGHLNYRAYVRGVIQAPVNVRLMDTLRNIING